MATGQYLTEVALRLVEQGHQVTVVTSRRAYDHPETRFPKSEIWRGIRIYRIDSTGFGKSARWRRAADFASFLALCCLRLAWLPRHDAVVALTSPPLISFLGALLSRLRGSSFFYWVMDFNPDEAIAAGWLRAGSSAARILDSMSRFSLRQARRIIVLDKYMRHRVAGKGISAARITVIPPWSHDTEVRFDPVGRERFRQAHGLIGKFVVMYSGNHSPCHPLDTLLAAARRLAGEADIVFCFVGGGSEWRKIKSEMESRTQDKGSRTECRTPLSRPSALRPQPSTNLKCLPYQPLDQLSASLSAADLHVVVMGNAFVGLVHPCKIYNVLSVAAPVLYIGPRPSHLSEILDGIDGQHWAASAEHGEVDRVLEMIQQARRQSAASTPRMPIQACSLFAKETLLPKLVTDLETG